MTDDVADKLAAVNERIRAACSDAGRPPDAVTLVAVGKAQSDERIDAALEAGQRIFGENYVQEAQARWRTRRRHYPDVELHMVGPLQSNKAGDAVALFDVIQTLDRPKLASALRKEIDKQDRSPRLYVQVNTGEEPQKAGIAPDELDAFIARCRDEHGLAIEGLMAIPPEGEEIALHTAFLRKLADRNNIERISIGMSEDYETAVRFGADLVRVGSAIFGPRPRKE